MGSGPDSVSESADTSGFHLVPLCDVASDFLVLNGSWSIVIRAGHRLRLTSRMAAFSSPIAIIVSYVEQSINGLRIARHLFRLDQLIRQQVSFYGEIVAALQISGGDGLL